MISTLSAIFFIRPINFRRGLCGTVASYQTPVKNLCKLHQSAHLYTYSVHSFDTRFIRAVDEVCMLPPSPPKGGSKSELVILVNKNQFISNKLCYKVFLCEIFQWRIVAKTIPL